MHMKDTLRGLVDRASMRLAVVGDGAGNVAVAARPNFVYAQLGGAGGAVIEVRANFGLNEGDAVYVMLENPATPRTWRAVFKL